jgi:hypothetical protein
MAAIRHKLTRMPQATDDLEQGQPPSPVGAVTRKMPIAPVDRSDLVARRKQVAGIQYTRDLADYILQELANGRTLKSICSEPLMPTMAAVVLWANHDYDGFHDRYMRACDCRAEVWIDEIMTIADDATNDFATDDEGKTVFQAEHVQRSKLRIDTRKWFASKLLHKRYGDSSLLKIGDANGDNLGPITINVVGVSVKVPE